MPERAIELEEFGIRNNPNEWRLYYNEGFIRYMELKDYAGAAEVFARGARVPNAHPFMAILAGRMAEHAGDQQMARMMWSTSYQTTKDNDVRANAAAHLRALQVDEDVTHLEGLTVRYQQRTGRFPSSFAELQGEGWLRGTPADPLGRPYQLMPNGRVEVRVPDDLPFIQKARLRDTKRQRSPSSCRRIRPGGGGHSCPPQGATVFGCPRRDGFA